MPINELPPARILGIESSCDETAAAVVENGRMALSNVVASQAEIHAKYGGIFPEIASREHIRKIYSVVEEALIQAHLSIDDIDAIAVTRGPGLPGSLVVGLNMAKGLALGSGKPLVGVNHLEGHLYSAWIDPAEEEEDQEPEPVFPLLALLVSGGHTELVLMDGHLSYQRLGGTLDDAAGEAFDKIGRLLELPYPGGPSIQKASEDGYRMAFKFPRAWLEDTWDFSFSGLKTAVLHKVRELRGKGCHVVGLLSHMGYDDDLRLAKALSAEIDFLIGGHSHTTLHEPENVQGVPVCHAGEYVEFVGQLNSARSIDDGVAIDNTLL